jgi:hypothetical protein
MRSDAEVTPHVMIATPLRRHTGILLLLLAMMATWPLSDAGAGHGTAPPRAAPIPGLPLSYCRPLHLAAEPREFMPGELARRFLVFVDRECVRRSERVEIEVWDRAPYRDGAGREAFGMPYLVGFVQTTTDLAGSTPHVATQLPHFDVPGEGFRLHPGCYVGRIRIMEHVGEIERCAIAPRLSLP